MTEAKCPLGATGTALMRNIAALRRERHMTYKALSERLTDLGRPIPTLGLSRIERGERRVDADDLVALSTALETGVLSLLGQKQPEAPDRIIDRPEILVRVQVMS